ncbi:MAG: hypothetical protein EOM69_04870 [Clostridia bacterium]|nr:hypothetical protein [Clostridia bacterium]
MQDTMLVLDFDREIARLIARTLRSQQIYCELVAHDTPARLLLERAPKGMILAAGHESEIPFDSLDGELLQSGVPVLALGNMVASLCVSFGGTVTDVLPQSNNVTLGLEDDRLFSEVSGGERVLHDLHLISLPDCLRSIATATERCIGFRHNELPLYAIQYPIERNDPDAIQLLRNFACNLCGMFPGWDEAAITEGATGSLREEAGDERVLCAVSGGVDSAVCAKLCHMALGDRVACVFVDTGLLREDEADTVIHGFMETMGLAVEYIDAKERFLRALDGVNDDGEKSLIVSAQLVEVLAKRMEEEPDLHTLVLGTNLGDRLTCDTTISYPEKVNGQPLAILEPAKDLFKEEVRRLALYLALPGTVVERQPFPASGLALRIFGTVTEERLNVLRAADAFFVEEIRACGHEKRLWQYYATLTRNPSPPYGYAIALRSVQAGQSGAYAARLPYDLLERVTERILRELPGVTRVLYDLTPSVHYREIET